jgi:eukaryotic-like serine/threonine-protein kinase
VTHRPPAPSDQGDELPDEASDEPTDERSAVSEEAALDELDRLSAAPPLDVNSADLEDDHDPFGWIGATIADKYTVESVVGEGGFGVVYRAHHRGLAEAVAIKCLKVPEDISKDARAAFLETFLAEGRILHQISRATADVVQALDVGEATSPEGYWTPYIVLEWVDGASLGEIIQDRIDRDKGGFPLKEAIALLEPAARALAVAHEQGVAHRDIKPSNLLLAEVGTRSTLKVVDFGIAKALAAPQMVALRRSGAHSGTHSAFATQTPNGENVDPFTPRYGAPEQFSKKYGTTGPWTDVFALALVLVETITAKPAFEGDEPGQFYVASSDLLNRPTPRKKGISTPDAVEQVFLRALAVDPKRRYQTAGEFWDALVAAVPDMDERVKSVKPPPSVDAHGFVAALARKKEAEQTRSQVMKFGLVLAVLASAAACAFLWLGAPVDPNADERAMPSGSASSSSAPYASLASAETDAAKSTDPPNGMVYVPAAKFTMGSDKDDANEKPAHVVTISHGFFLDKTEVRASDYAACVGVNECSGNHLRSPDAKDTVNGCNLGDDAATAKHPANCIDQEQAIAYCKYSGKRLPTEAEWELAARGTDGRTYPWGNQKPTTCWMAIVGGVSGACARKGTWEVGTTADGRSPFGAYDMSGNVWEWVVDGYESYPTSDVTDPVVPGTGLRAVLRGGSWDYSMGAARTTSRLALSRGIAQISTGFRCAKDAP